MEERNVMGGLSMHRQAGTGPNFTAMGGKCGMGRRTVARYWREGAGPDGGRREKASGFDQVRNVIEQKAALPGITKKVVHEFLLDRHPALGLPGYGAFAKYRRTRGVGFPGPGGPGPHPRCETPPGRQMQFDWKEDLRMADADGEAFEFNVFSATVGFSRPRKFTCAPTRTVDELLGCLLGTFRFIGGIPGERVADNMSALATISGGRRRRSGRARRFAKEAGFGLRLCRVRTPETEGKDESANRFVARLMAYDRGFEGPEGLLAAIARIGERSDSEPNETTELAACGAVHEGEGAPAPGREHAPAGGDGRRREDPGRAGDDARARGRRGMVGAPRVHRAQGRGGGHAGRADPRHHGRRARRGARRIAGRARDKL